MKEDAMTTQETIPIVVGVTGHRDIRDTDRNTLYDAVQMELSELRRKYPHSPIIMLNSLAEGADQLCAEAAMALAIPLTAVLPMEKKDYETDFSDEARAKFRMFCDAADTCFVAPHTEQTPSESDRDDAYRQAGIYVATHAHVLLALWDGKDTPNNPCGTSGTVRCVLNHAYCPKDSIPLQGFTGVLQIFTPRSGDETAGAGEVRFLGNRTVFDKGLARTDEFNRLAAAQIRSSSELLPEDREPDERLDRIEALYTTADALSVRFAKQYRRILAALAVISTVITVAFLLYDEAELHWMILVCGGMLLAAWFMQRLAKRTACHRRYLEYRTLAEGLRVQAFLRYAGSDIAVADILPWSEQTETGWIAAALKTCVIGAGSYQKHSIRESWAEQQESYHLRSVTITERAHCGSDRIVRAALLLSILLYLGALVFELFWGGLLPSLVHVPDADRYRTWIKLLLGGISAATLFISNYFGRLSLSRLTSDHRKMAQFYAAVQNRIDRYGETEDLLQLIAKEELIENGTWNVYRRDDDADFSL